jgi:hypothetical protein
MTELERDEAAVRDLLTTVATVVRTSSGDEPEMVRGAVRRGRRRKAVSATAAGLVAVAAVAAVGVWLVPGRGASNVRVPSTTSSSPYPSSTGPTSPSAVPSTVSPTSVVGSASSSTNLVFAACTTAGVEATVTASDSVASQPFAAVALRNTGSAPCTLRGYPDVAFLSVAGASITTAVSHGSTYEVPDPGPVDVTIGPGDSAHFTLGTLTATGGPVVGMPDVLVSWGSGAALKVRVDLAGAAARDGEPIPVIVTAFALGAKDAALTP